MLRSNVTRMWIWRGLKQGAVLNGFATKVLLAQKPDQCCTYTVSFAQFTSKAMKLPVAVFIRSRPVAELEPSMVSSV